MSTATLTEVKPLPSSASVSGSFDWWLLLTTIGLVGFGFVTVLSASLSMADLRYGNALHFLTRQGLALFLGTAAAVGLFVLSWKQIKKAVPWGYGIVLLMCCMVFTPLGHGAKGAHRWVDLGVLNLQPAEFAKVAVVLVLAAYINKNAGRLHDIVGVVLPALGIMAPLLLLILIQPDFGSTVVLFALVLVMLWLGGLSRRWFMGLLGLGIPALLVIVVMAPYRVKRLISFRDPFADPEHSGYQVIQGWIALASGGLWGNGLGTGVAQRGFLPDAHTDFISAVVGEELGALGWVGLVSAYVVLVWRGTHIASRAPDLFGALVAMGITALLAGQAFINLGVIVGLVPAKGLVLPFMSYGASAMVTHIFCIGLLLRIGWHSPRLKKV